MKNRDFRVESGPNPDHFAQKSPDLDQSPDIRTKVGALDILYPDESIQGICEKL